MSERDHESSAMRRPWPTGGCCAMVKKNANCNQLNGSNRTVLLDLRASLLELFPS